jgi:hypothetical protein
MVTPVTIPKKKATNFSGHKGSPGLVQRNWLPLLNDPEHILRVNCLHINIDTVITTYILGLSSQKSNISLSFFLLANAYSPTRFSKKLVLPSIEIISIKSNGFALL